MREELSSMAKTPMTPDDTGRVGSDEGSLPATNGHIGRIVAGSLATGVIAALLLVAAPFIEVQENDIIGAVLVGFALGWAMLAVLSVRYTDRPQRWAVVPAAFMGVSGLLLIVFGSGVADALHWMWPPAVLVLAVWMAVQAHRHLPGRSRRWLLYPVIAVMALASVGGGYETVREHLDASAYPMPGRLVDVGGHRLHLHCTGSGSPTVVLQPGGGDMSSVMGWIAPAVAEHTRVCVYDSAGRGWSEASDTTQDGEQMMIDLHTLLHRAHVPGPYVLAGHSFGGLYVRIFAARYPHEVAGMVLIDSTGSALPASTSAQSWGPDDILARVSVLASTRPGWASGASSDSATAASRSSPRTRWERSSPPRPVCGAPSTSSSRPLRPNTKRQLSPTSATGHWSSSPPAAGAIKAGWRRRTRRSSCRPTACTASSTARRMQT
jgi:pimeloyl-ACP methyl ester carboxylesterase